MESPAFASVPRESTPPLVASPISPSLQVESIVQNEAEKEKSPPLMPAIVETMHTSPQIKHSREKKKSQSIESGGSKQAVEQVPIEKSSFAVAEGECR